MNRRPYKEDPLAWDMATRQSWSYDEYNPFKGFRKRTQMRVKLLYGLCTLAILGSLLLLAKV